MLGLVWPLHKLKENMEGATKDIVVQPVESMGVRDLGLVL